jgi:hypothetical protein
VPLERQAADGAPRGGRTDSGRHRGAWLGFAAVLNRAWAAVACGNRTELGLTCRGPGYRVIADHAAQASASPLSKSAVGDLLNGKANPRRTSFEAFVLGCLHYARTRKPPTELPDGQDQPRYWTDRYDDAAGRRDAIGGASPVN